MDIQPAPTTMTLSGMVSGSVARRECGGGKSVEKAGEDARRLGLCTGQ